MVGNIAPKRSYADSRYGFNKSQPAKGESAVSGFVNLESYYNGQRAACEREKCRRAYE